MGETRNREVYLWSVIVFLVVALAFVITLDLWGLRLWGNAVDYTRFGNWSDAISGIATTAAVVVALAAAYLQNASQRATEAARQIEAETAVFQWLNSKEVRDDMDNLIGRLWDIRIQNSTAAPIYHWKVSFSLELNHLCNYQKRPLLPGENVFNLPFLDNVQSSQAPEPSLIFEGRSGRIWTRSARGVLEQNNTKELDCLHSS